MRTIDKRYGGASAGEVLPQSSADWLLVTLIKSAQHLKPKQRGAARVLGLRRIGDQSVVPSRPELLGVARKIPHVISVRALDEPVPGVKLLGSGTPQSEMHAGEVPSKGREATTTGGGEGPPSKDRTRVRSLGASEGSDDMSSDLKTTLTSLIHRLRPELDDDEVEERSRRSASKPPNAAASGRGLTDEETQALEAIRRRLRSERQ